jgi:hypothetical protein
LTLSLSKGACGSQADALRRLAPCRLALNDRERGITLPRFAFLSGRSALEPGSIEPLAVKVMAITARYN